METRRKRIRSTKVRSASCIWDWASANILKMNFSVGVSMYREKVTSYWYFFSCNHCMKEAKYELFLFSAILPYSGIAKARIGVDMRLDRSGQWKQDWEARWLGICRDRLLIEDSERGQ